MGSFRSFASVLWQGVAATCFKEGAAKKTKHIRNPVVSSARCAADFYEGGHSHVQDLRNSLALQYVNAQGKKLCSLPKASVGFLEISFDESEQVTRHEKECAIFDMLMLHARLRWKDAATKEVQTYEITLPPAFLRGKTAGHLLAGVLQRLPISISMLKRKCLVLAILIMSDSARACKKMGRHFMARSSMRLPDDGHMDGLLVLHSFCLLHQVALVIGALLKQLRLLCPLFCACCLLQRGTSRRAIVSRACQSLQEVTVLYGDALPSMEDNMRYLESLFERLDWADLETEEALGIPARNDIHASRRATRKRLARLLAASRLENDIVVEFRHLCKLGCHTSVAHARADIDSCAKDAHLKLHVGVPAVNRTWA